MSKSHNLAELFQHGGRGSGNHGHAGRPGKVGGSAPGGTSSDYDKVAESLKKDGSVVDLRKMIDYNNKQKIDPSDRFRKNRGLDTGAYWVLKDGTAIKLPGAGVLHAESAKKALNLVGSKAWNVIDGEVGGLVDEFRIARLHIVAGPGGEWAWRIPKSGLSKQQFELLQDLYFQKSEFMRVKLEMGTKIIDPDFAFKKED